MIEGETRRDRPRDTARSTSCHAVTEIGDVEPDFTRDTSQKFFVVLDNLPFVWFKDHICGLFARDNQSKRIPHGCTVQGRLDVDNLRGTWHEESIR